MEGAPAPEGPPEAPEASLPKRIFRGGLFLAIIATGFLIAHHRHPAMKGAWMGPEATADRPATGSPVPPAGPLPGPSLGEPKATGP